MNALFRTVAATSAAIAAMVLGTAALAAFPDPYPPVTFANGAEAITNVSFAGINNSSAASSTLDHEDFTGIAGAVDAGDRVLMTVQGNTYGAWDDWITVYVDWDQDGIFARGGDEEYHFPVPLHDSDGVDGKTTAMEIAIPLHALAGPTRMRVLKKYGPAPTYAAPDNAGGWGQAEDYTIDVTRLSEPYVTKSFAPALVATSAPSTLTITLGNTENLDVATLVADFTDTFPAGLVIAAAPNAASDCGNAALTANPGAGFVTLASGATIPAGGSCTISVDVGSAVDDTYTNTIAAGALQTDKGDSPFAAAATLRVGIVFPEPYCTISFGSVVPISNVAFASIDNPSDPAVPSADPDHEDFTAIVATVVAGDTVPLAVQVNTDGDYVYRIMAYIDWNGDGDFDDDGETIEVGSITDSDGIDDQKAAADILIPLDAVRGRTRMRITNLWMDPAGACGSYSWGQAEDYTIEIRDQVIFANGFEP